MQHWYHWLAIVKLTSTKVGNELSKKHRRKLIVIFSIHSSWHELCYNHIRIPLVRYYFNHLVCSIVNYMNWSVTSVGDAQACPLIEETSWYSNIIFISIIIIYSLMIVLYTNIPQMSLVCRTKKVQLSWNNYNTLLRIT